MLPLLVRIRHTETAIQYDAGFRRSPVRIGRNHLNDLTLDEGIVSQWHGIVRFDEEGTRFLDVGSTNGTTLDDTPLETNNETEVTTDDELAIGPIRLMFLRMPLNDDQILSRRASAFRLGPTRGDEPEAAVFETVSLNDASPVNQPSSSVERGLGKRAISLLPSGKKVAQPLPAVASADGIAAMAKRMGAKMKELNELYRMYDAARAELEAASRAAIEGSGSETERTAYVDALRGSFERVLDHPEFCAMLDVPLTTGGVDGESWLSRLVGPANRNTLGDTEPAMERAGALLETFATAYVAMMSGQQQVNERLDVTTGSEGSTLRETSDARQLLTYLLDPNADPQERLEDLSRGFADIVMHQLGMLNGVIDGAWALMSRLSPQAIGAVPAGSIVRTSPGLGDYLWPFRAAGHYFRYTSRHMDLSSEEKITKVLFGRSFAKAYYRVTGANAEASRARISGSTGR